MEASRLTWALCYTKSSFIVDRHSFVNTHDRRRTIPAAGDCRRAILRRKLKTEWNLNGFKTHVAADIGPRSRHRRPESE